MALISTTTPLAAAGSWTSATENLTRATEITGSVFTDAPGTLFVEQSGDGTHFDLIEEYAVDGTGGVSVKVTVALQWFRLMYINGDFPQTTLRVFADLRDEWGNFFPTSPPSEGGAWAVLFYNPARKTYDYLGRFNGSTGQIANGAAALSLGKNGKYASFLVDGGAVTEETLQTITEHGSASF